MHTTYINIYQSARNSAGITGERAAELLGISVESLRVYEGDKRTPPNTVVAKMIELYGAPYLAVQHINTSARELSGYLPDVKESTLAAAVLRLQKEVNDYLSVSDELTAIACDDEVSPTESARFSDITRELYEMAAVVMSLRFIK